MIRISQTLKNEMSGKQERKRSELTAQKNGTRQNTLRTKRTEQERTL